jgi:hypothetical protein
MPNENGGRYAAHQCHYSDAAILLMQGATAILSGDHYKSFFEDANQHAKHAVSRRYAQRSSDVKLASPEQNAGTGKRHATLTPQHLIAGINAVRPLSSILG